MIKKMIVEIDIKINTEYKTIDKDSKRQNYLDNKLLDIDANNTTKKIESESR